jgi:PKD repeat protein
MSNILTKRVFRTLTSLLLLLTLLSANVSFAQVVDNDDNSSTAAQEKGLLHRQQAINKLGGRLASVAARHGKSESRLRRMFLEDETLHVDETERLLYVEKAPDAAEIEAAQALDAPQAAPFPYSETFNLHSRPGASRKIYLDFNGHTIGATNAWRQYLPSGVAAPYDLDGNPNSFSAAEQDVIQSVWQRMAEDFAPFDVNVTTQDPGPNFEGSRAVMTPTNFMGAGVGGVAYVGVFGNLPDYQPAWIFTGGFGSSDKGIAEAASHEVGHNLGLNHDGTSSQGYYAGHGVWAPIMGVGYNRSVTQWSRGEYPGANNTEDDLAIMRGFVPLIADDYGNTTAAAHVLSGTSVNVSGLITSRTDVDVFKFVTAAAGNASLSINPAARGANLDIKAQLLDAGGNVIATSDPSSFALSSTFPAGLAAGFNQNLAAGTYYLRIDGNGSAGDDTSAGYSDYASIGQYTITGTLPATGGGSSQPPVAVATINGPTAGTTPFTVNFSSAGSFDPDGTITAYNWNFGDGTASTAPNPTKVYSTAGTFTASLTVTDNSGLTSGASSVVISVSNPVTPTPTPTPTLTPTPTPTPTPSPSPSPSVTPPPPSTRTNVALAANGGTASASSASYEPGYAIDGIRTWATGLAWKDDTPNSFPDWLQVDFNTSRTINEIAVYAVRDDYTNTSEPTDATVFSIYGIVNFDVQYWNGSGWTTVPGGSVTNNNRVITRITFPSVTTTRIRVVVNAAQAGYSRIVELEAWSGGGGGTNPTPSPTVTPTPSPTVTPTPSPSPTASPTPSVTPTPGPRINVALAANGGLASASSEISPASAAIDGVRNWATTGAWKDSTPDVFPDWLQVDFTGGAKTINEIAVYGVRDDYLNTTNPGDNTTFSIYGLTNFNVQYWNGSSWVAVPNGNIANNNKVVTRITFAPITTTRIRVVVNAALANYSRIVELEVWGTGSAGNISADENSGDEQDKENPGFLSGALEKLLGFLASL